MAANSTTKKKKNELVYTKTRDVQDPKRGTPLSAGFDIYVPSDYPETTLRPGQRVKIPSGLRFLIPEGHCLMAKNKSGLSHKLGLVKTAELIDEDYEGEAHICLVNSGNSEVVIRPGDKITQLVCAPVTYSELVSADAKGFERALDNRGGPRLRGDGGFGSTGG